MRLLQPPHPSGRFRVAELDFQAGALIEKRLLQVAVAIAGIVPVSAGALGVLWPQMLTLAGPPHAMTHVSYLSGLLLGIGLVFWSLIPTIERHARVFTLLTFVILVGGLARLAMAARTGAWGLSVTLPLVMELGVTPLLCLWQHRIARTSNSGRE